MTTVQRQLPPLSSTLLAYRLPGLPIRSDGYGAGGDTDALLRRL